MSQSPQAGQFNSYMTRFLFLFFYSLNPLKRVNSILTKELVKLEMAAPPKSQSPQAGQFNSYGKENAN